MAIATENAKRVEAELMRVLRSGRTKKEAAMRISELSGLSFSLIDKIHQGVKSPVNSPAPVVDALDAAVQKYWEGK